MTEKAENRSRRPMRTVRRVLLVILALLILLILLLQVTPVQNAIVDNFAKRFSEQLGTTAHIDHVKLNILNDFVLEGVHLEGVEGDTIFTSKRIYLDVDNPLTSIWSKDLKITGITLAGTHLKLTKDRRGVTNFDHLISRLRKPQIDSVSLPSTEPQTTGTEPQGDPKQQAWNVQFVPALINLENVSFHIQDSTNGKITTLFVPDGEALLTRNKPHRPLIFDYVNLESPKFSETIQFDPANLPPLPEANYDPSPDQVIVDSLLVQNQAQQINDSIIIRSVQISDAVIALTNEPNLKNISISHVVDIADLDLSEVNANLTNFIYLPDHLEARVNQLNLKTEEGFTVTDLSAKQFLLTNTTMHLDSFLLSTPFSTVQDDLRFKFQDIGDFREFDQLVFMDGLFKNSNISIRDLLYFSSDLNEIPFFTQNQGERVTLDGRIYGTVNNLRVFDATLRLKDLVNARGDLAIRNVTKPGEELLNFRLDEAQVNILTLRELIPNFNLPENYNKLGDLIFSGNFDGFFQDFVAFGSLDTDLGRLETDLRMEFTGRAIDDARYSGSIDLINFDLGGWSDNTEFGAATFHASISGGEGFSLENASGLVRANLASFEFQDYIYENVQLEGNLNARYFDGLLFLSDENANFDFDGSLDFTEENPKFDFTASVENLNLKALNLSDESFTFSGDVDFDYEMYGLVDLDGHIVGYDLEVNLDDQDYHLDYIEAYSSVSDPNKKKINLKAPGVLDLNLSGAFDLLNLPGVVRRLAYSKHPLLAKKLNLSQNFDTISSNNFEAQVHIMNSQGLEKLIHPDLDTIREFRAEGNFLNDADFTFSYDVDLDLPAMTFDNNGMAGFTAALSGENSKSQWNMAASQIRLGKKYIEPLEVETVFEEDRIFFNLSSDNVVQALDSVYFEGALYLEDDLFVVDFEQGIFTLLGEPWSLNRSNSLLVGDRYINTENLVFLAPDNSFFRINSTGNSNLIVEAEQIDISFLDELIDFNDMRFAGRANLNLEFDHIFDNNDVNLDLNIDSVTVNDVLLGTLSLSSNMDSIGSPSIFNFGLIGDSVSVLAQGDFFTPIRRQDRNRALGFDIDLNVESLPLIVSEFFIGNSISNTTGFLSGKAKIISENQRPAIYGSAFLDGSTKIDYLGTTYRMENQQVRLTPTMFEFNRVSMLDKQGNKAVFIGGLPHDYFKRFKLDATIVSPRFIFLDTKKGDNELFYGFGIGQGQVSFSGDFKATDIRTKATTGTGSKIFIPINEGYALEGGEFFRFSLENDSLNQGPRLAEIEGIDFEMELQINPDAEIQIIFDEQAGEIIKGTGRGDLTIDVSRDGDFTMVGDYTIANGEYLFTYGGIVNKPFIVERGGQILWSGDPYNAELNISAKYAGLRTSPKNLISEFLTSGASSVAQLAEISTDVDLILKLRGILSAPEIDFEILFPEIDPQLKNLVDSRVRILREDPSELNRQVVGLLLLNTFLPPSTNFDLTSTTVNTLSELITSQLSNFVAAYLNEAVNEIDYISGIDFYFDYNFYRSIDVQQATNVKSGSEFAFAPNIRFFDDRLSLSPGVSVIDGTILQGSSFIGTDIQLDYFVTDDRRLRLSLFHKAFPSLEGRRNKLGLGLRFFNDYDSYRDIFRRDKKTKKPKDEDVGVQ